MTVIPTLSDKIDRQIRTGGMSFKRYTQKLYDRPKASLLPLKARMVRSEVVEALLYGCATWAPMKDSYNNICAIHHRMLLRILGAWCKSPNKRIVSNKIPPSELNVRRLKQPYTRGSCCVRGRCSAWVTTGCPRGSYRESWRIRENVGRGGRRKNRRTAWQRIVGYSASRATGAPPHLDLGFGIAQYAKGAVGLWPRG